MWPWKPLQTSFANAQEIHPVFEKLHFCLPHYGKSSEKFSPCMVISPQISNQLETSWHNSNAHWFRNLKMSSSDPLTPEYIKGEKQTVRLFSSLPSSVKTALCTLYLQCLFEHSCDQHSQFYWSKQIRIFKTPRNIEHWKEINVHEDISFKETRTGYV